VEGTGVLVVSVDDDAAMPDAAVPVDDSKATAPDVPDAEAVAFDNIEDPSVELDAVAFALLLEERVPALPSLVRVAN
jgi:hypothetical protein